MYLGIDVGTTSVKAVLTDAGGRVVAGTSSGYGLSVPAPGWAEQDPEDWWRAAGEALGGLGDLARVKGVALTGQMHGCVLVDAGGRVIRPAILWCDQRTGAQARRIEEELGRAELMARTGNVSLPGFTLSKLLWVREHEPDLYDRTRALLLPKDYIRYRLTGQLATDVSDASGTLLFDVRNRRWSRQMAASFGIDPAILPPAHESVTRTGSVTGSAALATGLPAGIPVFAGAGDQAAGAVGCGAVRRGVASVVLGTSGVVFTTLDAFPVSPDAGLHNFCHAVPGTWHVMGVILSAGYSLDWWVRVLAAYGGVPGDFFGFLDRSAGLVPPGSEGLLFLPYLMGERTPHADPLARGAFVGLTTAHGAPHLARAVMEGVAFALYQLLRRIRSAGLVLDEIRLTGGGARLATWRTIVADVCGLPVQTLAVPEGAALGAALLAAVGCGAFADVPEACTRIEVLETRMPDPGTSTAYQRYFPLYDGLYGQLRETMHNLAPEGP